jgi:ABC-type transport system involved in multi-copper enzyme maturation permease subunit
MFRTLIRKELLEQLISPKFLIVFLLCLVLVPAGLLINYSSYEESFREYDAARRISPETTVVFREPSVLGTFGVGLESVLPKSVAFDKFSREESGTRAQNEVLSNITGKIDFVTIVGFLLGLFAILYSSTLMAGEKESGTLKLVLSNQTRRSTLLLSKFLGGFIVLVIPLAVSFLIGLLLLLLGGFPLFEGGNALFVISLFALSLIYLSVLFTLGLLISTQTHKTSIALMAGFLIWIFMTFVIPKISEPLAGLIKPIQSVEVMKRNRTMVRNQIEKEKGKALDPLRKKFLTYEGQAAGGWKEYAKARGPVAKEFEERIAQTLREFDTRYEKEKAAKLGLSLNIGRLSPASIFTNTALVFCHTGIADRDNFIRGLDVHQQQLFRVFFSKMFQDYFDFDEKGQGHTSFGGGGSEEEKTEFPVFAYRFLRFDETLSRTAPDLLLLVLYNLIFFAAAYYSFTRYDVR